MGLFEKGSTQNETNNVSPSIVLESVSPVKAMNKSLIQTNNILYKNPAVGSEWRTKPQKLDTYIPGPPMSLGNNCCSSSWLSTKAEKNQK